MEHAIGEVFEYEGKRLKVIEWDDLSCGECVFKNDLACEEMKCVATAREDKKNVIFIPCEP